MKKPFKMNTSDIAATWLNDPELAKKPIFNVFMDKFLENARTEFEDRLKSYLYASLAHNGFEFLSDDEFFEFIKERVHRIGFEGSPMKYQFYLDFVDEKNRGVFLGEYSEEVKISHEGNVITATIGRNIS